MSDPFIGEIRMFAGTFPPSGWFLCQGQQLQIHEYQPLYAILGAQYGGNGITSFNLPDLRNTFPLQPSDPLNTGTKSGSATAPITLANLPSHTHFVQDPGHYHRVTVPAHTHTFAVPCDDGTNGPQTNSPVSAYPTTGTGVDDNFAQIVTQLNNFVTANSSNVSGIFTNPPATMLFSKSGAYGMARGTTGSASSTSGDSGSALTGIVVQPAGERNPAAISTMPPSLAINFIIAHEGFFPVRG